MTETSKWISRKRLAGVLRLSVFLGFTNVLVAALLLPVARAAAEEKIQARGIELLQRLGPAIIGAPQTATINGQRMSLAFKATSLPLTEVLARFERYCSEESGGLGREIESMPETRRALDQLPAGVRDPSRWFTSRQVAHDGNAGQIVCLSKPLSGGGLEGLVSRIMNFLDTGDLATLGDARYVVARRDRESGETHVLAIWTEGSFNIPDMFAEAGDAPGADSRFFPRPPDSRRVFSAEVEGHPYALRMYDTSHSQAEVLRYYAETSRAEGFRSLPFPHSPDGRDLAQNASAFAKDDGALIVVVNGGEGEPTGVTLIEMGGQGFVRAVAAAGAP